MDLRSLFQWAVAVKESGGVKSSWPERTSLQTRRTEKATLSASTRRASSSESYPPIRKAIDVIITVEACDSTSFLVPLLAAPTDDLEKIWKKVPVALVCDRCRIKRYTSQIHTRRCPRCKGVLLSYPDMILEDEEDAIKRLNRGGVKCE
jgi:hypothetical protein